MENGLLCHPDLDDSSRILVGWNYSGSGDSTDVSAVDGHGTFVTGIAAASADDYAGIAGVCPECKVMVFKSAPVYQWCSLGGIQSISAAVDSGALGVGGSQRVGISLLAGFN